MPRRIVETVLVGDDRADEILALWGAARAEAGIATDHAVRARSDSRLLAALSREDVVAYLALMDGEAVGLCVTSANPFGLSAASEVAIEQLWVAPAARRHGVARSLLDAVLAQAERTGSDLVVSNVPTQSREANRFFARLGFSSITVRRVIPVAALRKRLHPETADSGLQQLLQRRRSLRTRAIVARG